MTAPQDLAVGARRPARWLAFVLNLVFAPAGYVYVGALRWAVGAIAAALMLGSLAMIWTLNAPPGIYVRLTPGLRFLDLTPVIGLVLAVHAAVLAGRPTRRPGLWRGVAIAAALWLTPFTLAQAVRAFAPIAIYTVASESMAPTLATGDILLSSGDRTLCGDVVVAPGDVIFARDGGGTIRSHRAVAGPGQTVSIQAGRLIIDGRPVRREVVGRRSLSFGGADVVRETLMGGRSYLTLDLGSGQPLDDFGSVRVPAGHWFTLGDSRDNAVDSRVHGPVAATNICGVATRLLDASDPGRIGTRP